MKGLLPRNALFFSFKIFFCFPCLHSSVSLLLVSFILSSHSVLSFLSFCGTAAVSASGLLWGQCWQNNKASGRHMQPWYTLYSINSAHSKPFYTHKELTHTHNPLLTDLTQTSTQTAWAPLHSVSVWQILNISNYFVQVSSQIGFLWRSPTAQEAQREDDKLSIRAGSGEFSSCLHTLCETRLSRPHVGSRGALIWLRLCHGCTWAELLFSSPPCSCYAVLLPKIVTLQERRGNLFLDEAARLDAIVVKGMMVWFLKLHFK